MISLLTLPSTPGEYRKTASGYWSEAVFSLLISFYSFYSFSSVQSVITIPVMTGWASGVIVPFPSTGSASFATCFAISIPSVT